MKTQLLPPARPACRHIAAALLAAVLLAGARPARAVDPLFPVEPRPVQLLRPDAEHLGLRLGMFETEWALTGGVTYDDNIALTAQDEQEDFIATLGAAMRFEADRRVDGIGGYLGIEYQPTGLIFLDRDENNDVEHFAAVGVAWGFRKLTLSLDQTFQQTAGAIVEIGGRRQQRAYNTDLGARYQLTEKMAVELGPRVYIEDGEGLLSSTEYAADGFLVRQFSPKVSGGLGGSIGWIDHESGPSERYERALGRFTYNLSAKVDAMATAGAEWRHYTSGKSRGAAPVFGLGLTYRATERTVFTIEGHRRDEPSQVFAAQDFRSLGASGELRQQIRDIYFVRLNGGYDSRDYRSLTPTFAATREDDYYFGRVGAGADLRRHWSVEVFAQYQRNDSTLAPRSFVNRQAGVTATWRY